MSQSALGHHVDPSVIQSILAPLPPRADRRWAAVAHLGGIVGVVPSLLVWLIFMEQDRFPSAEAKAALNFQITAMCGFLILNVLSILAAVAFGSGGAFAVVAAILWATETAFCCAGFRQARRGYPYDYPWSLHLVK
ncbi:DUF4870 domain-containing protein [Cryobacterium zhongshanensis]|uniref:DUF4870 domain-containing protein n=1 Tax=Cryobacterium zhongshanensis TaxID=2928153 RepID=A0AA41R0L1_9MICO|nr:DUF4870 domain-containing protein [Cryobacterium zhongshanensis]MCI4660064.1 DUF4870 domain-containing protein [Cryobacterium zhongshanensis]